MAKINGFSKSNMKMHYLGIDVKDNDVILPRSKRSGILFVGRLVEKKGLGYLIDALSYLEKDYGVNIPLTVVGDGPLRKMYESQVKNLNLNVSFLGSCENKIVKQLMAESLAFCMPSTRARSGDNEGLPTVFMEALSKGTPVISFDQGPIPEIVIEGNGGYLAVDKSSRSLSKKLLQVIENVDLWERNSLNGQELVLTKFNMTMQYEILEDYYDQLSK
jgi:colanic acid/amylovoran biosynthesis glycosyltransferase